MLTIVPPGQKLLGDYREVMGEEAYQEVMDLARLLAGEKVLHVNATANGGGVVEFYDYAIFTLPEFANGGLDGPEVAYIPSAIDPLTLKNSPLAQRVIDAYREAKKTVIDLQLVMVAAMLGDDPEGWVYYEKVLRRAGGRTRISTS